MARSSFLLFKRPSAKSYTRKMYYLKIWLPKERRYTVPKSLSVLAEQLGVDAEAWPPSTKAGARHIADKMEKTAGWGFFEVSFNDMPNGKFRGNITVKNCFLAYKRKATDQNHCAFLCGYMEEIISAMAGFAVNVKETQCGNQDGKETCWFSFEPK